MRRVLALDREYEFARDVSDMKTAERGCHEAFGVSAEKVCVGCGFDLSHVPYLPSKGGKGLSCIRCWLVEQGVAE